MPASCSWAASSPSRSRGACRASRRFLLRFPARGLRALRADPERRRAPRAGARSARASSCSSTVPRASRRTIATTSAKRPKCATCSWPRGSIRSASRRAVAPARSSRSGSRIAARRWTWPTSTCAASCRSRPIDVTCTTARSRRSGLLYAMHWPYYQYQTARGARRSPLHDRLRRGRRLHGRDRGLGAAELVRRAGLRSRATSIRTAGRTGSRRAAANARPCATRSRFSTRSCFAKFIVQGADACSILNALSTGDVDVAPGRIVYTQWLNDRGGIEADLTITRLAEREFMVVTSAICQTRDLAWLKRAIEARPDAHCTVTDVTSGIAMLGVMGPRSRELLQAPFGRGPVECSASVRALARNRDRLRTRPREPHHVRRRTRLGTLFPDGALPRRLRTTARRPARRSASSSPVTTPWAPAASRKATVTGATTSPTRTRRSKPASDSRSPGTSRAASLVATRCWRSERSGTLQRRLVQVMLDDASPTAPLLYHEEPILRDGSDRRLGALRRLGTSRRTLDRHGLRRAARPASRRNGSPTGRWEIEVAGVAPPGARAVAALVRPDEPAHQELIDHEDPCPA